MPRGEELADHALRDALARQPFLADLPHQHLQPLDPLDQPGQLLGRDLVMRRITRIDIGPAQQFRAALGKSRIPRPGFNQPRLVLLAERAQEIELVRLGAVERPNQQIAVVQSFGSLMEVEGSFIT